MESDKKTSSPSAGKLFVYGTLHNGYNLSLIIGRNVEIAEAVLTGYSKNVSRLSFPYIIEAEAESQVIGGLVDGLRDEDFEVLDMYEDVGRLYLREVVTVESNRDKYDAFVYVAGPDILGRHIPDEKTPADRIAGFLRDYFAENLDDEEMSDDMLSQFTREAKRELLGGAMEELLREVRDHPTMPRYIVKKALKEGIPSLKWIKTAPEAEKYAENYIRLIIKSVIFNQIEKRIREDFAGAVEVDDKYYERTVSSLAAFLYIADNLGVLRQMTESLGICGYDSALEYIDYAVGAIFLADTLYEKTTAESYIDRIRSGCNPGGIPLGGEVELSPLGYYAVNAPAGLDDKYDGFYYFDDFDMVNRMWKFGGHIDNHTFITAQRGRVRGFLEFAFGRYKVLGDMSKPTTKDPWVLSELANAAVAFAEIKPHSFHISIQVMGKKKFEPIQGPGPLICLLLLGGDINPDDEGRYREKRIHNREIFNEHTGLEFSRLNDHRSGPQAASVKVVEYLFPRLFKEHHYVDLITALKGYQIARNPIPLYISGEPEYAAFTEPNREIADALFAWAADPTAPSDEVIGDFAAAVQEGLEYEQRVFAGHDKNYIANRVYEIESKLKRYKEFIESGGKEWLQWA